MREGERASTFAVMTSPELVPVGFEPPTSLATDRFRLEPLGPQHNRADHAAWTSSIEHIRSTPGYPDGRWPPPDGMTLEQNLADLRRHADDFARRVGFTFTVLDPVWLASGLDDFPHAFPPVYRATVMAGEQAGQLDSVLERLADYTESRHGLRQKVTQAMVYPILLTTIALIIIVVMLVAVVPKVVGVFETTGQELPMMTRVLIAISNFVQNWWFLLLGAIVGTVVLITRLLRQEHIRRRVHGWLLRAPIFGRVTRGLNTARFTRTLSILTASGVPALEALRISASVIANLPMRAAVEDAAVRVREGGAIGRSLSQSKLFPPMSVHLISSGEASGELDSMLERAANHQESEMDSLLAMMLSVLEPLLIVVMGLVVLAIVMAILLPIFQINQLVR